MPASSYNELFGLGSHSEDANLVMHLPLQDDAASTTIDDTSSADNDGTLAGGNNSDDLSATGPNGWLAKSFLFGTNDRVEADPGFGFHTDFTIFVLVKSSATGSRDQMLYYRADFQSNLLIERKGFDDVAYVEYRSGSAAKLTLMATSDVNDDAWHDIILCRNGNDLDLYQDGVSEDSGTYTDSRLGGSTDFTVGDDIDSWIGNIAGFVLFDRALDSGERAELRSGPEPLNTVAPSVSGSLTQGDTLTNTAGSWDSQSNGTVTITRQWYRANDASGTGAVAISGETGATYDSQAADVGKYIACLESASNDGGNDADEDTYSNWRGPIVAGGPASSPWFFRNQILGR